MKIYFATHDTKENRNRILTIVFAQTRNVNYTTLTYEFSFMKQPLGITISNRKSHAPKTMSMRQHRIVEADRFLYVRFYRLTLKFTIHRLQS